jgi:hypothetical protein
MSSWRRWAVVALGVLVLISLPAFVARLPTSRSSVSAAVLLERLQRSATVAYSGFAESSGSLSLPVTATAVSSVSDLLSARTQLRVWWRSADDWRVDAVDATGERDVHGTAGGTWLWDYERNTATFTQPSDDPEVRMPQAPDLVPASLARRLLSQALPDEVQRLPAVRIAGKDAAGLRLTPSDPQSSIAHVDAWALAQSGLPVRVAVYAKGVADPVFTTSLEDLSTRVPSSAVTGFDPPASARIREEQNPDVVAEANQLAHVQPPAEIAGLHRNSEMQQVGSVGVYGRGVTILVAIPLPARVAVPLDEQLRALTGAKVTPQSTMITLAPVTLLLTAPDADGRAWLLTGTISPDVLGAAAIDVPSLDEATS